MTARATWRDDAACRHADPDLFFPIGATGPALRQISEAKRICRACPARTPCLAWALENGVTDGVWGATTPDERRAIRTLPRRTTTSQEDDDGEGYLPAEHAEQEIRAQAAQGKQPGFSAALELAMDLAGRELRSRETQHDVSASEAW